MRQGYCSRPPGVVPAATVPRREPCWQKLRRRLGEGAVGALLLARQVLLFVTSDAGAVEAPDLSASCRWHVSERPDCRSCDGHSTIVFAAEASSQKGYGRSIGSSPKSYRLAEVANAVSLGSVGREPVLVLRCPEDFCLTLAGSVPLQNHCIDRECGAWSWCESC